MAVRLVPAWYLENPVSDIPSYIAMANIVLRGDDIYAPRVLFPYTPYSQFIPASMMEIANATGWRFDFAIKLPSILADGLTTLLIFGYVRWKSTSPRDAR